MSPSGLYKEIHPFYYSIKILARNNSKQIKILVIKECNLVSFSLADFLKLMHLAYSINKKSLMLVENY